MKERGGGGKNYCDKGGREGKNTGWNNNGKKKNVIKGGIEKKKKNGGWDPNQEGKFGGKKKAHGEEEIGGFKEKGTLRKKR